MSHLIRHNGSQIAGELPPSVEKPVSGHTNAESLADLLTYLNSKPSSQTPMLRSTAGKIAAFLGESPDQISFDLIHANRERFRPFLKGQRHKDGAVRAYVNYLKMLLDSARELGWKPHEHLSAEWHAVLDHAKKNKCVAITKFLAQTKESPEQISQDDLEHWLEERVTQGLSYGRARDTVHRVWNTLIACGYGKNAPIAYLRQKKCGILLSDFPSPIKEEVTELLRWKSAEYEPERPNKARIREVSAKGVQQTLGSLFGFAVKIRKNSEIKSLDQLLQKPIVAAYISWCVNVRKMKGGPLVTRLASVLAAVSKHPAYKSVDLGWYRPLLNTIPIESYEEVKARKAKKFLEYDALEAILPKIHAKRASEAKRGKEHEARLAMEELMFRWFLVLPWRQRNLRECRVEGSSPNLFKAKVPVYSYIDKPLWAHKEEARNPDAEFWQFKFSREETKTGVAVHSLVPRSLISQLEEYLSEYRPLLLKDRKCDSLLISPDGDEMDAGFVNHTISGLTLRYGGRRVTPHLFRDIVAFEWLRSHPGDYLRLSKMLWHKNVQTTINIYGSRYNQASGVIAMDEWLEEREKRSTPK